MDTYCRCSLPSKKRGAHGKVPVIPQDWPDYLRIPGPGDSEKRFHYKSSGKPIRVRLEILVGMRTGAVLRPDLGETCIAVSHEGGIFQVVGPKHRIPLTDRDWMRWRRTEETALLQLILIYAVKQLKMKTRDGHNATPLPESIF